MCWKFSIPLKKILIKKILRKYFIKSPYYKRKKEKKNNNTHLFSPNTWSHTTKWIIPWKIKKSHLLALKNNQTSPSHATQGITLWVSPHPKYKAPIPIPLKKSPLERGGITPSSPPHPKVFFWKKNEKS